MPFAKREGEKRLVERKIIRIRYYTRSDFETKILIEFRKNKNPHVEKKKAD